MSDTYTQSFPISDGGIPVLRGSSRWISVDIVTRPGMSQIDCEATSNFLTPGDVSELVHFWAEDNTVFYSVNTGSIRLRFGQFLRLSFTVPEGTTVMAEAASGSVRMTGTYGTVSTRLSSGTIRIDRASGVYAEARSGSVKLGDIGPAKIRVTSGSVRAQSIVGQYDIETTSGTTSIERLEGDGSIAASSGTIRIGTTRGALRAKAGSGTVHIGELIEGSLSTDTRSGSQKIGVAPGTAVLVDAHANSGGVRSSLQGTDPTMHERTAEIHAVARSGSIRIYRSR